MTKRFGLSALLGASALVLSGAVAMAQSSNSASGSYPSSSYPSSGSSYPSSSGYPSSGGASGGAQVGGSAIDTSTTTSSTTEGYGADPLDAGASSSTDGSLANTGGEPLIISMLGTLMIGSGLVLRRKFS